VPVKLELYKFVTHCVSDGLSGVLLRCVF